MKNYKANISIMMLLSIALFNLSGCSLLACLISPQACGGQNAQSNYKAQSKISSTEKWDRGIFVSQESIKLGTVKCNYKLSLSDYYISTISNSGFCPYSVEINLETGQVKHQ
jgi:hypothetical protein